MAKRRIPDGLTLLASASLALASGSALAIDYRSVEAATVLYDAPSVRGKPLFVIKRLTPVEPVVSLEGWTKVRDAEGGLAWIEKKYLSEQRTVLVVASQAQVRREANDDAPLVFEAEKGVALELVEPVVAGWARVKHRDGQAGFVRAVQVWGL
ncbi:MAG: SH3 domain-containing protein [Rhodocyclaceae bacterium]|jgi:SH3-like domain-containing protein